MKIRQLGSSVGDGEVRQHLTTFLVNDSVAIDAGCLGLLSPIAAQRRIKHVFLSHSHLDHIATLPSFLDTVFQPGDDCPTIYASGDVWNSLNRDVMNERLWPDLLRLAKNECRFFREQILSDEVPVNIEALTITPVSVNHIVPSFGFLIEDDHSAVVISSDTGPTQRLWDLVNQPDVRKKLRAVYLECSFPNSHEWLATESGHMSTSLFANELKKIAPGDPFQIVGIHLKPSLFEQTVDELTSLEIPDFEIGAADTTWVF